MTRPDRRASLLVIPHSLGCPTRPHLPRLAPDQCRSLLEDLAAITDPRHRRRRHTLGAVLAVAVTAVLTGARSRYFAEASPT
jgi:hypothetical protein